MRGGYNIATLVELLDGAELGAVAAEQLKHTLLMFDAFHDVAEAKAGNQHAKAVMQSWAEGEWFTNRPAVAESPCPSSRSLVKPTPTTCRRLRMPGRARTSRCTLWPC